MLNQQERLRKVSKTEYVRRIKRLNARFRKLKKRDGPVANQIAERKDALIDAVQANCLHQRTVQTDGDRDGDLIKRMCCACGLVEHRFHGKFDKLDFARAVKLKDSAYR